MLGWHKRQVERAMTSLTNRDLADVENSLLLEEVLLWVAIISDLV